MIETDSLAHSDLDRMIECIRETFEMRVAPAIADPLARSYGKTISVLLGQVRERVRHELQALNEDAADLSRTLGGIGIVHEPIALALPSLDAAALESEIARLDAMLVAAMPKLAGEALDLADDFMKRRIERRRRWMPDATPSDAF